MGNLKAFQSELKIFLREHQLEKNRVDAKFNSQGQSTALRSIFRTTIISRLRKTIQKLRSILSLLERGFRRKVRQIPIQIDGPASTEGSIVNNIICCYKDFCRGGDWGVARQNKITIIGFCKKISIVEFNGRVYSDVTVGENIQTAEFRGSPGKGDGTAGIDNNIFIIYENVIYRDRPGGCVTEK